MKLPLSVGIITDRNDELFYHCLYSVRWAQEILIIDHNSGNDWKTLKKQLPITIVKTVDRIGSFANVRTMLLRASNEPWFLFLDSDERLPEHSKKILASLIRSRTISGYTFHREDYFLEKPLRHGEPAKLQFLRLFETKKGRVEGSIHEVIKVEGTTAIAPVTIQHYSHPSISSFLDTVSSYAHTVAEDKKFTPLTLIELLTFPCLKFLYNFFIRQGFRDGFRGIMYAFMMSLHSLSVRAYTYEHHATSKK